MNTVLTMVLGALLSGAVGWAVEILKTRRAADFWLAQERWKLKRETYVGLLETLTETKRRFASLRNLMLRAGPTPTPEESTALIEQGARLGDARVRLDSLTSTARLWLNDEAVAALERFAEANRRSPDVRTIDRAAEAADNVVGAADEAIFLLTRAAQRDFRLGGK